MKIDGECLIELIRSCRNKVQVYRSVRMSQLHTSLHFHLTPIVMINGSSRRDLLEFSKKTVAPSPQGQRTVAVSAVLPEALGSQIGGTHLGSRTRERSLNALTPTPDMDRAIYDVLNPAHVPLLWAKQPNLGTYYSPRWRRATRGAKPSVDVSSWGRSAWYPLE
ncbi:hypothetical protein HAX54_033061 [Datura stramonium]|uniref:Uncharacterized protein n=1 Tax=Datura stramonium TaxID=4076 RepID=A0ABS8VCA9_DATST|nr:hypothetical protein [Datura stramonium]